MLLLLLLLVGALVEVERVAPGVVAEGRQLLLLLLLPPPRAAAAALGHDLVRHRLPPQLGARRPRVVRGGGGAPLLAVLVLQRPVLEPARRRRPRQRAPEAAEALRDQLIVAWRRHRRHGRLVHEAGHGHKNEARAREGRRSPHRRRDSFVRCLKQYAPNCLKDHKYLCRFAG